MADREKNREKFRPQADAALDQEINEALRGVSIEALYGFDKPEPPRVDAKLAARGLRRGRVVAIEPAKDEVFVDLGGKDQGIAPLRQFEKEPKIGEEFDFRVDHYDPREGLIILSLKGATSVNVTWDNLEIGQIVEGTVTGMNKGGLELQIRNMRGFMPASQVDVYFHKDISVFLGQRMKVEVVQFDRAKKNLIVSRRNVLEREKEEARKRLLEELADGQIRRGTVRSVTEYGAFVDLGGIDGLVHISEMTHRRIRNPSEVVKVGDTVDVKILKVDRETGKLSLSLRQAMEDPWQKVTQRYAPGALVTARVAHIESFGAFLEVEEGIEGLLPASEVSWQRVRNVRDVLKEGQTIQVVVLSLDVAQKRMTFSLKQAGGDPWVGVADKYPKDSVVTGKITRVAEFGAFVELEAGLEGLVHISELSAQRVKSAADVVKPEQTVRVRVLDVDEAKRRISLSIRRAEEPAAVAAISSTAAPPAKKKRRAELRGGLDL